MTRTTHVAGTRSTGDGFHLQIQMAKPDGPEGLASAVASFTASLDNTDRSDLDLAGISGLIVDTAKLDSDGALCITIHDALKRHTPPKRTTLASDHAAQRDLDAGTDGRIRCDTRYALFMWLPQIHDERKRGSGTRLLQTLQDFLSLKEPVSVLVDFDVQDEQDGFLEIFFPELSRLNLTLSKDGQFARGKWSNGSLEKKPIRDIGIVYL